MMYRIPGRRRSISLGALLLGELNDQEWAQTCSRNPAPLECFSANGVLRTVAIGNAREAGWENQRNVAIYENALENWRLNGSRGNPPNSPELLSTNPDAYIANAGRAGWVLADGSVTTGDPTGAAPIMAGTTYSQWTSSSPQLLPTRAYETAAQVASRLAAQSSSTPKQTPKETPQQTPKETPKQIPLPLPSSVAAVPQWFAAQPWYIAAGIGLAALLALKGMGSKK